MNHKVNDPEKCNWNSKESLPWARVAIKCFMWEVRLDWTLKEREGFEIIILKEIVDHDKTLKIV